MLLNKMMWLNIVRVKEEEEHKKGGIRREEAREAAVVIIFLLLLHDHASRVPHILPLRALDADLVLHRALSRPAQPSPQLMPKLDFI